MLYDLREHFGGYFEDFSVGDIYNHFRASRTYRVRSLHKGLCKYRRVYDIAINIE